MIHTNRIRKSKKKLQYGGQLYDILPEYKDGFVGYKGVDSGIILKTAVQLQKQYDDILNEKKEALKSIRDAKVHTIYNGLKTQLSEDILKANKSLLEKSNNDVLSPIYSQGIMNVVDEKMNGREWTAALGNSPQLEEYETNKQRMLESGNVQNYDDPNLPVYNEMVKGNNIYNPFVPRGIFETPNYDAAFDAMAKEFPEEELTSFLPIKTTDSAGNVTYEPFDVMQMDTKIKSELGLKTRYETMLNNFYTTAAGASFARKVAQDLNLPPNPDGSVNMSDPTFKAEYNKQVLEMMSKAAIRNQAYAETAKMTTMAGKLNQHQFQEKLEFEAKQAQANRDQATTEADKDRAFRAAQAALERDDKDGGSGGSGTKGGTTPKPPKDEDPNYGIFSEVDPAINMPVTVGFGTEDNQVTYSTYQVNAEKAQINYDNKLKAAGQQIGANTISIQGQDGAGFTSRNYDVNNKNTMYEDLINYYDSNNDLNGLSISFDGIKVEAGTQKMNDLSNKVKELLIDKKMKESAKESVTLINKEAFEKLKTVTVSNVANNTQYQVMKNNANALYDNTTGTIVRLNSGGELEIIDYNQAKKDGNGGTNPDDFLRTVDFSGSKKYIKPPERTDADKFIKEGKDNYLESIGYYERSRGSGLVTTLPILTPTAAYKNLTPLQLAEIERNYILSDEYKKANSKIEEASMAKAGKEPGIRGDIRRKLNEVSTNISKYKVENLNIISIPNKIDTKQSEKNNDYFSKMNQVASTMTNSPGNLALSVYELNTEGSDKGITPSYWGAIKQKSIKKVGDLGDSWIPGYDEGIPISNAEILLTGVVRDDKLGACFYGNVAYDITARYSGNSEKASAFQENADNLVAYSKGEFSMKVGVDGKTYLIHNLNFLVKSEFANKSMYEKEYQVGETATGVASQYDLLVKGFSNNELTTLKLDTYSSSNDIRIEKNVDKDYNLTYRLYWNDVSGKSDYQTFSNLSDVAKATYDYNYNLKQLDQSVSNSPRLQNTSPANVNNATHNHMLLSAYNNLVQPTQQQIFAKDNTDKKDYFASNKANLYYSSISANNSNVVTFNISKGTETDNDANTLLLRAIREITNIQSIENGNIIKKDNSMNIYDRNTPIDSKQFTPVQRGLLKKYFGTEKVEVAYDGTKLTITRPTN